MGPVGEGCALVDLVQKLLLHLRDGITIQNLGGQGLVLAEPCTLHQNVQRLQNQRKELSLENSSTTVGSNPRNGSITRVLYSTSSRNSRLSFRVYLALPVTASTGPLST